MSDYGELTQIINSLNTNSVGSTYTTTAQGIWIWGIIALILAIVGGILVYFLFVKAKTPTKGKFVTWLKDFLSFKIMWIEALLKIAYYIATIFIVLFSFSYLALGGAGFLAFILTLVLGPIVIRLVYEASLMFVMIWHNTKEIAGKK
ncbi:hypothetical protein IKF73_00060 [Candidatus Saccharibacteria bacterium]|nr:hypothetical protein [Candidatus Saccharibacteria bacterium]